MKDNLLAEEKLLRLIRKEKKLGMDPNRKISAATQDLRPDGAKPHVFSIQKYSSFAYAYRIILTAFVAACLYLIFTLMHPWVGLKKIELPAVSPQDLAGTKTGPDAEIKPAYEFYSKGIQGRQMFNAISDKAAPEGRAGNANEEALKDINLVGIVSGENPQAVFEDKKTQKTYYVTKGNFIGGMQLEDIQEGKVILNYNGRRLELYI